MFKLLGVLTILAMPIVLIVGLVKPRLISPGMAQPSRGMLFLWLPLLFVASGIFAVLDGPGPAVVAVDDDPPATTGKTLTAPESERAFVKAIKTAQDNYAAAPNELKKSNVKIDMIRAIHAAVPQDRAQNWYGTLRKLATNGDGDAYIEIEIAPGITVSTWNNALSDIADHTLIRNRSDLYNGISNLAEGAVVSFDAQLLQLSDLTEAGSVNEPDMIARFSRVEAAK